MPAPPPRLTAPKDAAAAAAASSPDSLLPLITACLFLTTAVLTVCNVADSVLDPALAGDPHGAVLRFLGHAHWAIPTMNIVVQAPVRAVLVLEPLRGALAAGLVLCALAVLAPGRLSWRSVASLLLRAFAPSALFPLLCACCMDRGWSAYHAHAGGWSYGCPVRLRGARDAAAARLDAAALWALRGGDPLVDPLAVPGFFFAGLALSLAPGAGRVTSDGIAARINTTLACVTLCALGVRLQGGGSLFGARLADARLGDGAAERALAARLRGCADERELLGRAAAELLAAFPDAAAVAVATTTCVAAPAAAAAAWPGHHHPPQQQYHLGGPAVVLCDAEVVGRSDAHRRALALSLPRAVLGGAAAQRDASAAGFVLAAASAAHGGGSGWWDHSGGHGGGNHGGGHHGGPALVRSAEWEARGGGAFSDWAAARAAGLGGGARLVTAALRPFSGEPIGFVTVAAPAGAGGALFAGPPFDGGGAGAEACAALARVARAAAEAAVALRADAARAAADSALAVAADMYPPHGENGGRVGAADWPAAVAPAFALSPSVSTSLPPQL